MNLTLCRLISNRTSRPALGQGQMAGEMAVCFRSARFAVTGYVRDPMSSVTPSPGGVVAH